MKVVTIATESNKHLERLFNSAKHFDIPVIVLGKGKVYRNHNDKTAFLLEFLDDIDSSETVLYVDGFDCVFLRDLEYIERQFKTFNHPFVISTEQNFNCGSSLLQKLFYYFKYPAGKKPYRFLNAGSWIAKADYARSILEKVLVENGDDQDLLNKYLALNHDSLSLDYRHEIFTCTAGRSGLETQDYEIEDGMIKNQITDSYPAIFHAAGKNFIGLSEIIKFLPYLKNELVDDPLVRKNYAYSKITNYLTAKTTKDNFLFHLLIKLFLFVVGILSIIFLI